VLLYALIVRSICGWTELEVGAANIKGSDNNNDGVKSRTGMRVPGMGPNVF
jgi:hypothetical protein